MRYISAYSKSVFFKRIFLFVQVIILLVPVVVLLFTAVFFFVLGKNMPTIPVQFYLSMILMLTMAGGTYMLVRGMMSRFIKTTLDVSPLGLHHLAPGKEKIIQWQEVIEVKKVPYSKTTFALRLKTAETRYVIPPHLIPDTPDAPRIKFGLARQNWLYPDGRTEPFDVEHSFGWQLIKQYRPDLLPR